MPLSAAGFSIPLAAMCHRLCAARPLAAANLTIGLGTDVTAIDPHYHNVTPNNNVAAHLFGYLVERNEKSQLDARARHRMEDDRSD